MVSWPFEPLRSGGAGTRRTFLLAPVTAKNTSASSPPIFTPCAKAFAAASKPNRTAQIAFSERARIIVFSLCSAIENFRCQILLAPYAFSRLRLRGLRIGRLLQHKGNHAPALGHDGAHS